MNSENADIIDVNYVNAKQYTDMNKNVLTE